MSTQEIPETSGQDNNEQTPAVTEINQQKPVLNKKIYVIFALVSVIAVGIMIFWLYQKSSQNDQLTSKSKFDTLPDQTISPNPTDTRQEKLFQVCNIELTLPSFINEEQLLEVSREDPNPVWWTCQYKTADYMFSVTIMDKTDNIVIENFGENFSAFNRYQQTRNDQELSNIAKTDSISTSTKNAAFFSNINNNSVGYTSEIFQDVPGMGIYQTATELEDRYLVYVTYTLFPSDVYLKFVKENLSTEVDNSDEIYWNFLNQRLKDETVLSQIAEINQSTQSISLIQ